MIPPPPREAMRAHMNELMMRIYMSESVTFLYTPSQQALACLDLTLSKFSEDGLVTGDITMYFPELAKGDMR